MAQTHAIYSYSFYCIVFNDSRRLETLGGTFFDTLSVKKHNLQRSPQILQPLWVRNVEDVVCTKQG